MGSFSVRARVKVSGPLYDGAPDEIVHAWLDGVKRDIAAEGVAELRSFVMDKTGRATGRYQSEIQTTTLSYNDIRISDPVVYGPWLEGFSKRNRSTRFKGYHLWRITAQRLSERAPKIAEAKLPELIAKLGG